MTALRLDLHFEDLRLARTASPFLPCFVLVLFVSLALHAAGAMPSAARAEEKSSSSLFKQRIKAVTARLEQARIRLNQLSTAAEDVPPEATESEREEYYRLSNLLVNAYENHLDTLNRLKDRRETGPVARDPTAYPDRPLQTGPYTLAEIDDLWNSVRAKDRDIEKIRIERDMLSSLLESRRTALAEAGRSLRLAEERAEFGEVEKTDRNGWLLRLQELRNRLEEAQAAVLDTELELRDGLLSDLRQESASLKRRALAASRISPLSQDALDRELAELDRRQQDVEADIRRTTADERFARERLRKIREKLYARREAVRVAGRQQAEIARENDLQRALEEEEAIADADSSTLKALHLMIQALSGRRRILALRFRIEHAADVDTLENALEEIRLGRNRLAFWREFLDSDFEMARRRLDELERDTAVWKPVRRERAPAERTRLAYLRRKEVLDRVIAYADDSEAALLNLRDSVRIRLEGSSFFERMLGFYAGMREMGGKLWGFELFTVEDKIVAEGREIVGKRSVTVGKIIQVLAILGVGLWITARIANYGRGLATRRLSGNESAALLGLRLFTLVAAAGLVVFALVTVHIPLTVFTFLGGAMAIGLGFGAQNIINNFISGLILLVERPIKLGDIVEVDGIHGRVTHIGGRCCQVRRLDGIDMLIPNSSFLEKNVTNWTLSDRRLRYNVGVGIAYGSPVREAMDLVRRAAEDHPRVLKNPPPDVDLDEFGDNALMLSLDFWMDIRNGDDDEWDRVKSDIRLRIEELFNENGIAIAFPQRNIHFDSPTTVKVELTAPSSTAKC
ncbi:MAG: mechanosensitive ion channel domain-containing protein [Gammaproteobacteria bacterium]